MGDGLLILCKGFIVFLLHKILISLVLYLIGSLLINRGCIFLFLFLFLSLELLLNLFSILCIFPQFRNDFPFIITKGQGQRSFPGHL